MPKRAPVYLAVLVLNGCLSLTTDGESRPDTAASSVSTSNGTGGAEPDRAQAIRLRLVAGNLTSGRQQSYDPGEGGRIFQGLKPDVVLLQEFNVGSNAPSDLRRFVDDTFGQSFSYVRPSGGIIPNGVATRYPIIESGEWDDPQTATREFTWARIDVPGARDLWAVSVHLLTSSSGARQAEASAIVAHIRAQVPATDYLVVGGDFNTVSRGEACIRTFGEVLETSGPFPADASGNGNTSRSRSKPLDWLLTNDQLTAARTPVIFDSLEFPNGLVFDSRAFRPLTSVAPVRVSDSNAENMQHMAVVRDFYLSATP